MAVLIFAPHPYREDPDGRFMLQGSFTGRNSTRCSDVKTCQRRDRRNLVLVGGTLKGEERVPPSKV